ncbi:vacuolar amino acid transporter 1-like [Ananas comosus]|uniref:Vacuolar amino acid transporter 1-like n=1 Tax=Ananas comosus TaxID=4615 RepID=A0A6P5FT80_ANACO|nr:vacuolar amino acid transporter 1-like [Ananas comosus]
MRLQSSSPNTSSSSSPPCHDHVVSIIMDVDHVDHHGVSLKKPLLHGHDDRHDTFPRLTAKEEADGELSTRDNDGTSFSRTCLNLTNAISGIGVLSMPYALSEGGWLSLGLFFFVGVLCYYTGILIQRCMHADTTIRTYPDIGEYAFGSKGKAIIASFMYLELYLVAISFLILAGDNLDKLLPGITIEISRLRIEGKQLFILVAAALILPSTWFRNLGMLAYVSAGGVIASVILTGSLIWAGVAETGFESKGDLFNLKGIPTSVGLYFVCFTGHAVFPTIYTSMRVKNHFSKVLLISSVLCTLNYGLTAILGYLMYGEDLQSQVTLNLPTGKIYTKIAIYTTLINPLTKYALVVSPIMTAIEERLGLAFSNKSTSLSIRTLIVMSTVVVASTIPFFAYLMAFIGSFLSIMATVLFPCLCYLKIYKAARICTVEFVAIVGILVIGVVIAVVGTYSSVQQILTSL